MKRLLLAFTFIFLSQVLFGKQYPMGWDHSDPPSGDEFLTNRFGRSWSEPTYLGYLVVDDHYVDAPYVVEQRGFVIFVNNERVQDGADIRFVLPPPEPEPVTSDPGLPDNVTRTTRVVYALMDPVSTANQRYWDYQGLSGQARVDAFINYVKRLPCVTNVVDYGPGYGDTREVRIYDYIGTMERFQAPLHPRVPPVHTNKGQYEAILRRCGDVGPAFHQNRYLRVIDQNLGSSWPGPRSEELPQWYAAFRTMESDSLTATQRFERLKSLGMIGADEHMAYCENALPIHGFHTSSQLWQRLSGDMSWTNDGPARMFGLTNGWQKILPAFMRTQTVVAATVAVPPPAIPPKVTPPATETNLPLRVRHSADLEPSPYKGTDKTSTALWWLIAVLAVIASGLLFVYKRTPRQR